MESTPKFPQKSQETDGSKEMGRHEQRHPTRLAATEIEHTLTYTQCWMVSLATCACQKEFFTEK